MSTTVLEKLDTQTFPLHGNRLIEASAGTGKTYTIANLYLRLVLGHGRQDPLTVDQILVVTFTDAATAELKDRIRKKLQEARKAFLAGTSDDPFIRFMMESLDQHSDRARLLLSAERQMDESAVFTIHGFCQRMLKQHAFESGTLFSSQLITDESVIMKHAVADFWRKHFYPLDKPVAGLARKLWKTPKELYQSVAGLLGKPDLNIITEHVPQSMDAYHAQYIEPGIAIRELWKKDQQEIEDLIKSAGLRKNSKPLSRLTKMAAFAHSENFYPALESKESWEIYSSAMIEKALLKSGSMPRHDVFRLIDEMASLPMSPASAFYSMIFASALQDIRTRRARYKAEKHQMSFDDLLNNMRSALLGDSGESLSTAIRSQFPIAMIDEFQDTDPQQYDIFNTIYPVNNSEDPDAGLFMIGDPKQAIYAFRGADIFTYIKAKSQVAAHYSLDTNWRSSSNMVNSINRLFTANKNPFIYNQIPFDPVFSAPKADQKQLIDHQNTAPSLTLWLHDNDGSTVSTGDYKNVMTDSTVSEINRLLTAADKNQYLVQSAGKSRPLQAADIAIIVRTGQEASQVKQALADQNIPSVYMSSRDSVFKCQEASDLLRLLSACLNPTNDRILRAGLATPVLNMTAVDLDALNEDERAWESAVEEFNDYHQIWSQQGVLPMLRIMVVRKSIAEKLLALDNGERRLTDFLHLSELLASASMELESPHALLRWFSNQLQSPDSSADEQLLHLESERKLVQIVTIHKSKGLEYPVVFLPFACDFKEAKTPVYHDSHQTSLDLSGNSEALDKADKERLAEDLRLLYVALTRSIYACYVGLAPVKKGRSSKNNTTDLHKTSIGWLLADGNKIESDDFNGLVDGLAKNHDFINVVAPPEKSLTKYKPLLKQKEALSSREFQGVIEKNWWVTSYSSLSKSSHSQSSGTANTSKVSASESSNSLDASSEIPRLDIEAHAPSATLQNNENAGHINTGHINNEDIDPENGVEPLNIFTFPKGARPGTFLHTLFEEYPHDSSQGNDINGYINDYVAELLIKEGFEDKWTDTLVEMLDHCLNAPLDGQQLTLGSLAPEAQKAEMEFYIPVNKLRSSELNALLSAEDALSQQAGTLGFATVKGMLKGFIDLTFEYEGRWYVLDYKSNWLGEQLSDYSRTSMERVMIEHRYDLQYQIYSLALHRLLKIRLPDYSYEQHFGGVFYMFLRGVRKGDQEQHGIYQHRPTESLLNKLDNLFAGEVSC